MNSHSLEQQTSIDLTTRRWNLPWTILSSYSKSDRQSLIKKLVNYLSKLAQIHAVLINEISLWDWGTLVGRPYKAAIAGLRGVWWIDRPTSQSTNGAFGRL